MPSGRPSRGADPAASYTTSPPWGEVEEKTAAWRVFEKLVVIVV
jgi:hypothetical protein